MTSSASPMSPSSSGPQPSLGFTPSTSRSTTATAHAIVPERTRNPPAIMRIARISNGSCPPRRAWGRGRRGADPSETLPDLDRRPPPSSRSRVDFPRILVGRSGGSSTVDRVGPRWGLRSGPRDGMAPQPNPTKVRSSNPRERMAAWWPPRSSNASSGRGGLLVVAPAGANPSRGRTRGWIRKTRPARELGPDGEPLGPSTRPVTIVHSRPPPFTEVGVLRPPFRPPRSGDPACPPPCWTTCSIVPKSAHRGIQRSR